MKSNERQPATGIRGTSATLLAATFSMLIASLVSSSPAIALEKERVTIGLDEKFTVEYSPVAGNNPSGAAADPESCKTSAYCELIPLTVEDPGPIGDTAEYSVFFTLSWDTQEVPDPTVTGAPIAANDMDLYIYSDPYDPDAEGAAPITSGASTAQPESANLFLALGDYQIVVVNYLGGNTGFDIEYRWESLEFGRPVEDLGPAARPTTTPTTAAAPPRPTPTTTPAATTTTAPQVAADPTTSALTTTASTLSLAEITGLEDFGRGGTQEVAAGIPASVLGPGGTTGPAVLPDEDGMMLFVWLVGFPVALVGVTGGILVRRSATSLRLE